MGNAFKTFKIIVEYDGSYYHGWQKQKYNKTIQGEIENALYIISGQNVKLVGSGRTDAGVHALGQVASFKLITKLSNFDFLYGLNSILDNDIVVKSCVIASNNFHARFHAKFKTYAYYIINSDICRPIGNKFIWHISKKMNFEKIKLGSSYFLGEHNFEAFQSKQNIDVNTTRIISRSEVKFNENGELVYIVKANGFLRFMVRNIVGTLVDIGLDKIKVENISKIFISKKRSEAGITAPPHGLFLVEVDY